MNRLQSYAVDSLIPHGAPQPRSRKPAPEPVPSEQSTYHVRRGSLAHLSVRRCAPRQRSIRARFPSRAQHDRLCSRSPAASRETSMRNPVVPFVLLYSPLNLRLFTTSAYEPCRDPLDQSAVEAPGCEGDAARRVASPALRRDLCRAGRRCRDPAGTCTPDALCSDARPSHPSDYQTPCPDGLLGRAAKLLNYRGLIFAPCRNPAGCCSGLLQKGWQLVANDCRARFLTGARFEAFRLVKKRPIGTHTGAQKEAAAGRLLCLLGHVPRRERCPLPEKEVFHVLGDQVLRLLLPRHQAVLVQDHLHPLFPELPRVLRHVLVDALAELARPWRRIEARQLFPELRAHHRAPAFVRGGRRRLRRGSAGISHAADCS